MYFETIKSSKTNFCWHVQFIENILLSQCLKKETATAKELDLRPLGKVIIFRDTQTDRQTEPSYYLFAKSDLDLSIDFFCICSL